MKRFIVVSGNIGVGKSTLVNLLCQRLQWEPFFEPVAENPYLADFYANMRAWAFHSQIFFLTRRLRAHHVLMIHPTSVIQDRSVYEDAEIFAQNLYDTGCIDERDFHAYRELYEVLTEFLPPPDLVIYLQASVATLLERIQQRGRDYEHQISTDYLEQLNRLYEDWMGKFKLCPVLTIHTDTMDFVSNPEHQDWIVQEVKQFIGGRSI